ncbi:MAG: hypothetical protein CRN43_13650 [Candidatus Nephrothrix sp. EaCA]|nr:MAG: hypothetical protein CRN43_13650 [Candidatus Nephrothrix sp. EaCA]
MECRLGASARSAPACNQTFIKNYKRNANGKFPRRLLHGGIALLPNRLSGAGLPSFAARQFIQS